MSVVGENNGPIPGVGNLLSQKSQKLQFTKFKVFKEPQNFFLQQ
jgi:hypothetical protein